MSGQSETDILEHLHAGRYREAFELLLDGYQHKVFRLCCSLVGDEGLAEEVAQDAFFRAWKALPGFRGESALATWMYAISRNCCLTRLKREASHRTLPLTEAEMVAAPDDPPDIRLMVSQLPEKYRQVLSLFYWEDNSYEEVASMLDIPIGTVKTYLHRAKRQLAEVLHGVRRI